MNDFKLVPLANKDIPLFKTELQKAFQFGYEVEFGKCNEIIIPDKDIEESLQGKGANAFQALLNGEIVGGAVVAIDEESQHNHLDLLYVKIGTQSKGIGKMIWDSIEKMFPDTIVWETCTPYFEKRNIHFYVNKCGFHIVEFYNPKNPMPNTNGEPAGGMSEEIGDYFFRFEKKMQ